MRKVRFSKVEERHDNIIIVASGPSSKQFEPIEGWVVIAVNQAIEITGKHTDYWFTIDPSIENRRIMIKKPEQCKYYAAVPDDFGMRHARVPTNRQSAPKGVSYLHREYDPRTKLGQKECLSEKYDTIHTGNSAYGALGLAYLMGAKNIIILGVEASRQPKFDGYRCRGTLDHLPSLFSTAKRQLEENDVLVVNASPTSNVDAFPRTSFETIKAYFKKE